MNYRHAFHAGNFVDVVKHIILCRLIDYLKRKTAPVFVLDTHAGTGLYDLTGPEAERSPEWREGIGRLFGADLPGPAAELAAPYLDAIAALNPDGELTAYPGSPLLFKTLLRPQDRLCAAELHPEDFETLRRNLGGDRNIRLLMQDGWQAPAALLPPAERRGLVMIDPPFEEKGEFERLAAALVKAHRRFETGIFALWYPLKDPEATAHFLRQLKATAIPRVLRIELTIRKPSTPPRLYGSGMIVVNPPFVLEQELRVLLPALAGILADEGRGDFLLDWIAGE